MGFFAKQFKGGFCDLQYQHNSLRRSDRPAAYFNPASLGAYSLMHSTDAYAACDLTIIPGPVPETDHAPVSPLGPDRRAASSAPRVMCG